MVNMSKLFIGWSEADITPVTDKKISLSERAKLVSFFSKRQIINSLRSLNQQIPKIKGEVGYSDKEQINCLIRAYNKLKSHLESQGAPISLSQDEYQKNKLDTCISVCGDTNQSINGMTALRQQSFSF